METLQREFGDSHKLVHLIIQCLEYSPARRPSAAEALQKFQRIAVDCGHLQLEKVTISRDHAGKSAAEG